MILLLQCSIATVSVWVIVGSLVFTWDFREVLSKRSIAVESQDRSGQLCWWNGKWHHQERSLAKPLMFHERYGEWHRHAETIYLQEQCLYCSYFTRLVFKDKWSNDSSKLKSSQNSNAFGKHCLSTPFVDFLSTNCGNCAYQRRENQPLHLRWIFSQDRY